MDPNFRRETSEIGQAAAEQVAPGSQSLLKHRTGLRVGPEMRVVVLFCHVTQIGESRCTRLYKQDGGCGLVSRGRWA
jgi:hypothetical protein